MFINLVRNRYTGIIKNATEDDLLDSKNVCQNILPGRYNWTHGKCSVKIDLSLDQKKIKP